MMGQSSLQKKIAASTLTGSGQKSGVGKKPPDEVWLWYLNGDEAMANWIKAATRHNKGSFRRSAEHAGKSTHEYAEEKKHASGTLGRRARLALTLGKMHHR